MLYPGDPARLTVVRVRARAIAWLGIAAALVLMSVPQVHGPLPIAARGIAAPAAAPPAHAAVPAAAPGAAAAPAAVAAPGAAAAPVGLAAVAAALAQAQRTGTAVPVSFSLSEPELTAAAARSFPQTIAGLTLSDPVVHLVPGSAQLTATTKLLFVTTQLAVSTTPTAAGGRVVARLDSATLGGVGLPDAARGSIVAAVEGAIAQVLPAKLQVTAVTVGAGTISFQGIAQP